MKRKKFGKWGEDLAARFLEKHGFTVVESNYYCQEGEIDIVAVKDKEWWFIEVKTRHAGASVGAEEAVDGEKQEKMEQTALDYLSKKGIEPESWQLGLVSVKVVGRESVRVRFLVV